MEHSLLSLRYLKHSDSKLEKVLFDGIDQDAIEARNLKVFGFVLENDLKNLCGGLSGYFFYGSLHIDQIWVNKNYRCQGWGSRLMEAAENLGRKKGSPFATLNTMDWQALDFYQSLGYAIEFTRKGFPKEAVMYFLRKNL